MENPSNVDKSSSKIGDTEMMTGDVSGANLMIKKKPEQEASRGAL